jgi:hypothetical protein
MWLRDLWCPFGDALAPRTSADIVAHLVWSRHDVGVDPGDERLRSSRRREGRLAMSVGDHCGSAAGPLDQVRQASPCPTRISAAARAMAAYAPRRAMAALGVSSPLEWCTVIAAWMAVPGKYWRRPAGRS